jgi:hypothetical protein
MLLIFCNFTFCSGFAQSIPNPGFENWSMKYIVDSLINWGTFNSDAYPLNDHVNVSRSMDSRHGKYSVKLETIVANLTRYYSYRLGAFAYQGRIFLGNPFSFPSRTGIPYTDRPDSLNFSYKSDIAGGDEALFQLHFYRYDTSLQKRFFIGFDTFSIRGKHTNWADTAIKLSYNSKTILPDTILVLISTGRQSGNTLFLDNLQFTGANKPQQLPNNDFENWDSSSYLNTEGWYGFNDLADESQSIPSITKSTDAHSGQYAMQIQTREFSKSLRDDTFGLVSAGNFDSRIRPSGGFASSKRPNKFSFYYKYTPSVGTDSANAGIWLRKNGKTLDSTIISLPASSTYVPYQMMLPNIPGNVPDTINIMFASSNWFARKRGAKMVAGSTLLVDDLAFDTVTGIEAEKKNIQSVIVFPNPATGSFYLQCYKLNAEPVELILSSMLGRQIFTSHIPIGRQDNHQYYINSNDLAKGMYIYEVKTGGEVMRGKLIVE